MQIQRLDECRGYTFVSIWLGGTWNDNFWRWSFLKRNGVTKTDLILDGENKRLEV